MTSRPNPMRNLATTAQPPRQLPVLLTGLLCSLLFGVVGCAPINNSVLGNPTNDIDKTVVPTSPAVTQAIALDAEESRIDHALTTLAATGVSVTTDLGFAPLGHAISGNPTAKGKARLLAAAKRAGELLWSSAILAAQPTQNTLDDRPLYWQRLLEKREFKKSCTATALCGQALHAFEWASRGATGLQFETQADLRILISGFDPFSLDNHIDQSNPSGAAALALDGLRVTANGKTAEVQSVLFPVRFADFDEGMVETVFEPFVTDPTNKIDMLITISMGRSGFDLERFPGRRRSATAPDNLRVKTGANAKAPTLPLLNGEPLAGPEFVEFSLPVAAMIKTQTPYPVTDNHKVATLENGRFAAPTIASLSGQTAVSGSGGGYLSNEISYRTVRLVRLHNSDIAVGHLHTPRIEAFDQPAIQAISSQIQGIIQEAVRTMTQTAP